MYTVLQVGELPDVHQGLAQGQSTNSYHVYFPQVGELPDVHQGPAQGQSTN